MLASLAAAGLIVACGTAPPPPPDQPIAYSHKAHIDEGLECDRCHRGAESAKQAGLPAVRDCERCHRRVIPDHPEVVKLMEYAKSREPIRWRKVNTMPPEAAVHFDHGAHARADVGCEACHGDVGSMAVPQRVIDTADMGWCIDCHRERRASIDCLTCHH